ncbi:MAG: L,D-transpeptidase family protein [Acidithiobacillus sp.]|uniref:L,D-transpeptidase n=1 Tax=Acidithiobacillus sp. TaxID=1872118 RepID=UPI0025C510E3|nr:L,D-transpeptidase [Acidithiobacillus sp.]
MSNPSPSSPAEYAWLWVDARQQRVELRQGSRIRWSAPASTARAGLGELRDSGCTPRGWHEIRARIGAGLPATAILRGRRWTGRCWSAADGEEADWILGRILWLSGLESGRNRGGPVDTFRRYIYLHGTAQRGRLGTAASAGCVRLAPEDICALFELCPPRLPVYIGVDTPLSPPPRRY